MCEINTRWKMSEVRRALDDLESLLDRRQRIAIKILASAERYLSRLTHSLETRGGISEGQAKRLNRYHKRIVASGRRLHRRAA